MKLVLCGDCSPHHEKLMEWRGYFGRFSLLLKSVNFLFYMACERSFGQGRYDVRVEPADKCNGMQHKFNPMWCHIHLLILNMI
jgi:hypothetical protein